MVNPSPVSYYSYEDSYNIWIHSHLQGYSTKMKHCNLATSISNQHVFCINIIICYRLAYIWNFINTH